MNPCHILKKLDSNCILFSKVQMFRLFLLEETLKASSSNDKFKSIHNTGKQKPTNKNQHI